MPLRVCPRGLQRIVWIRRFINFADATTFGNFEIGKVSILTVRDMKCRLRLIETLTTKAMCASMPKVCA